MPIRRREKLLAALFLGCIVAAIAASTIFLPRLRTTYTVYQFMPIYHPLLQTDFAIRKQFNISQTQPVLVMLEVKRGNWLDDKRLEKLTAMTERAGTIRGVKSALSLASIKNSTEANGELIMGGIGKIKNAEERQRRVLNDPFLSPTLISKDLRRTIVPLLMEPSASNEVIADAIKQVRYMMRSAFPEAEVMVGGVPAVQTQLTALVKQELMRFIGLAVLASCLTLLFVFSTPASILVPSVTILLANILVFSAMAAAGFSLTVLGISIPILVSINVLSLSTHTMLRLAEEAKCRPPQAKSRLSPKVKLVITSLQRLFLPNLLTALTTSVGFATLVITDVPAIRDFGGVVAISMLLSWLTTCILLLPLMILLPLPVARPWVSGQAGWSAFIFKWRRPIILVTSAAAVAFSIEGLNLKWSARLFDDLPKNREARKTTEKIDRKMGGMISLEILVGLDGEDAWKDPAQLVQLDKLVRKFRHMEGIGSVVALPDLVRQALGDPTAKLPTTKSAVAEKLFLLGLSEDNQIFQFLSPDGKKTRIALRLHDDPSHKIEQLLAETKKEAVSAFPGADVRSAGMATTVHRLNNNLAKELLYGFWHALGAIALLLLITFRSWRWTLIAALPNLIPAAILIGLLAITQTPIKPGVTLVFSVALGFAFDNTVYILQRMRSILKDTGSADIAKEIESAMRVEGNPCLVSTMCLLSGFIVFLFSEFEINQTFGTYMLVALSVGAVGDLIFMPAVISSLSTFLAGKAVNERATLQLHSPTEIPLPPIEQTQTESA